METSADRTHADGVKINWRDGSAATLGIALVSFLVISAITHVHLTGDGPDYVTDVWMRISATNDGWHFWDFGHLLWRPLGYLVASLAIGLGAASTHATVGTTFIALSWVGGAACTVLLPLWLVRLRVSPAAALWATILLISANAFLSYYQGGSSYVPALAFLLLGLYLQAGARTRVVAMASGLALACAVLLWLPFVLAIPAALFAPVLLSGWNRERLELSLWSTATCAVVGLLAYGAVIQHLGITTPVQFLAWYHDAAHGITRVSGASRAVFGFARSFLNMGTDGALLKRFMIHDPLNPVSIGELVRASLGKMAVFYLTLGVLTVVLWRLRRREFPWAFCILTALPVLAFAVSWQGGDSERYFPLYPALLLAVAFAIDATTSRIRWSRLLTQALVVACVLVNIAALSRWEYAREEARISTRLAEFQPGMLPPNSMVVTPSWNDGLSAYINSGAQIRATVRDRIPVYGLLTPGVESASLWREDFAKRARTAWSRGGRIWLSRRALTDRPDKEWGWVEGSDERLHWADFKRYFGAFDLGPPIGGNDGWIEVLPTARSNSRVGIADSTAIHGR